MLWQEGWDARIEGSVVVMRKELPEIDCWFERRCKLEEGGALRLDYTIGNEGSEVFKYLYCTHALMAATEASRFELPDEVKKVIVTGGDSYEHLGQHSWIDWPLREEGGFARPWLTNRRSCLKAFAGKMKEGWGVLCHDDTGERLRVEFDTEGLPYLGILVYQDPKTPYKGFENQLFVALEPSSGMGDTIQEAAELGELDSIPAGGQVKFWVRFRVE